MMIIIMMNYRYYLIIVPVMNGNPYGSTHFHVYIVKIAHFDIS